MLKNYREFISENSDLNKSQSALDKFGLSNFDELPHEVKNACEKAGLLFENKKNYLGFGPKHFSNDNSGEQIEITVGMHSKDGKTFDSNSYVVIDIIDSSYADFSFTLASKRSDTKDLIKFLDNWKDINSKLEQIINELDSPIDKQSEIKKFNKALVKLLNEKDISSDYLNRTLNENSDDLSKSQSALDRFGLSNFDELPFSVQEECKKAGLIFLNEYPHVDGFGTKNYYNEDSSEFGDSAFSTIVGMNHNENLKFDKNSMIGVYSTNIEDNNVGFSFIESRTDHPKTSKFLSNMSEIMGEIMNAFEMNKEYTMNLSKEIAKILSKHGISGEGVFVH